jgi:uncharacterized membrane-anchored protein YhcB (DUF1043 family)
MTQYRSITFLFFLLLLSADSLKAQAPPTPTPTPAATGMDPFRKDLIDAVSKVGGVVGVFVAIFVAYTQVKKNRYERQVQVQKDSDQKQKELDESIKDRKQREEELRWRKSNLAREILKELDNVYTSAAKSMLIWPERKYEIKQGLTETITRQDVWDALRFHPSGYNETEKYIRECFGQLFSVMQTIEYYLTINLIEFQDIEYPFRALATRLNAEHETVQSFFEKNEYEKARSFLERFQNNVATSNAVTPL